MRFWRAKPARPDLRVVMFTRAGCCLCDDAWAELTRLQKERGFALDAVDVDSASEMRDRYSDCVPVVTVNGKVRSRGRFNAVLFARLLDAAPESDAG